MIRSGEILALAALLLVSGCPARRGGQNNGATDPGGEASTTADADLPEAPTDADLPIPDGSTPDAERAAEPVVRGDPADLTAGPVLGRMALAEGGPEVRVEAVDGGFLLRLAAPSEAEVSIEPIGQLSGPSPGGVFLGPRCRRAAPGTSTELALWTGRFERCVTTLSPMAEVAHWPTRPGCPIERVAPGPYQLILFACGSPSEPLFTVSFDIAAEPAVDGGTTSR
jgi:hypothetical protein